MEDSRGLPGVAGPSFDPGDWQRNQFGIHRVIVFATFQRLTVHQRQATFGETAAFLVGAIDIGSAPDVFDPFQNGMSCVLLDDDAASGVLLPASVVIPE